MSVEAVNDHVAEHEYMTGDERLIYESKDFYVRELAKIFNMLQSWLNYVIGADVISKQDLDMGIKLSREVRETIVKLAEFQGRLDKSAGTTEKNIEDGEEVLGVDQCDYDKGVSRMSAESNRSHSRSKINLDLVDTSDRDVMEYMEVVLRGRDPVWWVNNVLGMELYPAQEEIMREFYRSRYDPTLDQYKKLILVAGMRSGKTALASIMGCYEYWDVLTMTNPKPYEYYKLLRNQKLFIMVVATSEKQAEDGVFSNIQKHD